MNAMRSSSKAAVVCLGLFTVASIFFTVSCGNDPTSSSTTTNALSAAMPSVAVSSPASGTTTTTSSSLFEKTQNKIWASFIAPVARFFGFTGGSATQAASTEVTVRPMNEQVQAMEALLNNTGTAAAANVNLSVTGAQNQCYGQSQNYTNHPNANPSSGSVLAGDGLIQSDTETISGVSIACPAATLNSKIGAYGGLVNESMEIIAAMLAQANTEGKTLPTAEGDFIDVTALEIPNISVTTARLTAGAPLSGGYTVYEIAITGTQTNNNNAPVTLNLTQARASSTDMKGKFRGIIGQGTQYYGFSMIYTLAGGTTTYEVRSGQTRNYTGSTTPTLLTADGLFDFGYTGVTGDLENVIYFKGAVNSSTGLGSAIFAWNAGQSDSRARVFQVLTQSASPVDTGYAYAGFGPPITAANLTAGTIGTINGMICLWFGQGANSFLGGNAAAEITSPAKVQAMSMTRSATTGQFIPNVSNIAYCPTATCDGAAGMTVGGTACTAAHSLAAKDVHGAISVTAPTYP